MRLRANVIFQMLAGFVQLANLHGGMVPPKWQWLLTALVGAAQLAISVRAHFSNPDGTPAETPYVPPSDGSG
ncbi:MAG TPA: hypothetical protein VI756_04985 [Blastocatellia bacterium]